MNTERMGADRGPLPDICFLHVESGFRALLVRHPDGRVDVPHLRQALMILRGEAWDQHPRRAELLAEADRLLAEAVPEPARGQRWRIPLAGVPFDVVRVHDGRAYHYFGHMNVDYLRREGEYLGPSWEGPAVLAERLYATDLPSRPQKACTAGAAERDAQVVERIGAIIASPAHRLLPDLMTFVEQVTRGLVEAGFSHPYEERPHLLGRCWWCNGVRGGKLHPVVSE